MCDHPLAEEVFPQFQSASGVEFQLMSSCAVMFLIQHKETVLELIVVKDKQTDRQIL